MKRGWLPVLAASVFAVDQAVKQEIETSFSCGEERGAGNGRIRLRKVYNEGAMLGFLKQYPETVKWASAGIGLAALLYDAYLLRKKGNRLEKLGMMLVTGGGASNICDRLTRGRVIDYLGIQTSDPRLTAVTFNLADLAILAGALIGAVSRLCSRKHQ